MSDNKTPIKRFIAGAVCPKCGERDRIIMYTLEGEQIRECVSCDFKNKIHLQSAPQELKTRVNTSYVASDPEVKPINVMPIKPRKN